MKRREDHTFWINQEKLGWMSDIMNLTAASLQNHAHGSKGEEMRLAIPGRAFLVRPR